MKGGSRSSKRFEKYVEPISQPDPKSPGGNAKPDVCLIIEFDIQLQKVQSAISTVSAGDELDLRSYTDQIQAFNDAGVLCGYLVSARNDTLLKCMKKGYTYKAVVITITGRACRVTVKHR